MVFKGRLETSGCLIIVTGTIWINIIIETRNDFFAGSCVFDIQIIDNWVNWNFQNCSKIP